MRSSEERVSSLDDKHGVDERNGKNRKEEREKKRLTFAGRAQQLGEYLRRMRLSSSMGKRWKETRNLTCLAAIAHMALQRKADI